MNKNKKFDSMKKINISFPFVVNDKKKLIDFLSMNREIKDKKDFRWNVVNKVK